eukprot:1189579-Prorocentrum_minimum.AAC.1
MVKEVRLSVDMVKEVRLSVDMRIEETAMRAEAAEEELRRQMTELATANEQCQVATIQRSNEAGQALKQQVMRQVEQLQARSNEVRRESLVIPPTGHDAI